MDASSSILCSLLLFDIIDVHTSIDTDSCHNRTMQSVGGESNSAHITSKCSIFIHDLWTVCPTHSMSSQKYCGVIRKLSCFDSNILYSGDWYFVPTKAKHWSSIYLCILIRQFSIWIEEQLQVDLKNILISFKFKWFIEASNEDLPGKFWNVATNAHQQHHQLYDGHSSESP